jgi:hypothetical protein
MEMLIHPVKEKIKQLNVQVQTLQEKLSQCLSSTPKAVACHLYGNGTEGIFTNGNCMNYHHVSTHFQYYLQLESQSAYLFLTNSFVQAICPSACWSFYLFPRLMTMQSCSPLLFPNLQTLFGLERLATVTLDITISGLT